MHFLTAVPRIDGRRGGDDLGDGVEDLVDAVNLYWDGPKAPAVRMLPLKVPARSLPEPTRPWSLSLGVEETDLRTFEHDFDANPHLVVIGDAETGKTNLLSLISEQIVNRYTPGEARVSLVDVRRQLFDVVPESHQLGYGVTADNAREIVVGVADAMRARLPGPDITPARMKQRDWWSGPSVFLVVDDYDMVSGGMNSPFLPLLDYLAQGAELGLHVIVARSANGASRTGNDPLLRRLSEVNTPMLLLSCPPSEGFIAGTIKPRELPTGRAQLVTRRGITLVQTALHTPVEATV
jgi:S-DNA-T family DNA segregation ATPase FtsK/SpoIIIE